MKNIVERYGKSIYIIANSLATGTMTSLLAVQLVRIFMSGAELTMYIEGFISNSLQICIFYFAVAHCALLFRRYAYITPLKHEWSKSHKIVLIAVSLFFSLLSLHMYWLIARILLWIYIYFALKKIFDDQNNFINDYVVPFARNLHAPQYDKESFRKKAVQYISHYLLVCTIIIICLSPFFILHKRSVDFADQQRRNFTITKIEPSSALIADEVTISGYNFRSRDNETYIINSTYGPIVSNIWEDTKVTFIVPLHLKNGKVTVWLERSTEQSNTRDIIKSNAVSFKLLPRENFYGLPEDSVHIRIFKKLKRMVFL